MKLLSAVVIISLTFVPYYYAKAAAAPSFTADLSSPRSPFPHTWEECVGSGHAALGLRQDWKQQLVTVQKELGIKRVRFHGILDDDMGVVQENGTYNFQKLDDVYDYIVSLGMYPYVELSFMPSPLASGTTTYLHYKANVTPPKSYKDWGVLMQALSKHWLERYGEESISNWFIEVWNEPNLNTLFGTFWDGSQEQYFELYNYTVLAFKTVSTSFRVGGPASAEGKWLLEFMTFCIVNKLPVDFISTHHYPTDSEKRNFVNDVEDSVILVGGEYPIIISEYNSGLYLLDDNQDTNYAAAFIAHAVPQVVNEVDILSYWTFSDIFEEIIFDTTPFHDGYGMLTVDGIPKPAYRAFQLMHTLSNATIATQWSGSESAVTATVCVEDSSNTAQVLLANFEPYHESGAAYNVTGVLTSLPTLIRGHTTANNVTVIMYRVSETEANARLVWERMGRPSSLSDQQKTELLSASEVKAVSLPFTLDPSGNSLSFTALLPFRSMAVIRILF